MQIESEVALANPKSIADLVIPAEYSKAADIQPFFLKNGEPDKVLIFLTKKSLNLLSQCELW